MLTLKPTRDLVYVQMLADVADPGEPGVLAQVLAVGPEAKGLKAGDSVLVRAWCCEPTPGTPQPASEKRQMLSQWDIIAKVID